MKKLTNPPKGCRDFGADEITKREYLFNTIKKIYHLYGFQPLATPAMENLEVLTGKYGEEGEQLLFKILNSGDFTKNISLEQFSQSTTSQLTTQLSGKGLKYDLTIPFARYVAGNRHLLTLPFKRYQIQPVWRADRPQKGRYREFYQCDADVIGSPSLIHEAEIMLIAHTVLQKLGFNKFKIQLNHRGVLQGLCEVFDIVDYFQSFCIGLDKIEKIGIEKVILEWESRGIPSSQVKKLAAFIRADISIDEIKTFFEKNQSAVGIQAISDIEQIYDYCQDLGLEKTTENKIIFSPFLARGLNYYTGAIYEITLENANVGTIAAGGRYDNLTSQFGGEALSGIGISFGIDRIYDVMFANNMFKKVTPIVSQVLIFGFDKPLTSFCLNLLKELHQNDIASEFYTLNTKLQKALNFANKKGIQYVIIIGSEEKEKEVFTIKNMFSSEQKSMNKEQLLNYLST